MVGSEQGPGGQQPVILHWNGRSITQVPSPDPGSPSLLLGVARPAAMAVGSYFQTFTGRTRALIVRWDGRSWKQISSPDQGAPFTRLLAVTATSPSDVWAVGYGIADTSAGLQEPVAFHCC